MAKLFKLHPFKPGPPRRTRRVGSTVGTTVYVFRAPTVLPRQYTAPRPSIETSQNLLLTLLAAAAAVPFVAEDWTTPPVRRIAQSVDLVQNLLLTLYPTTLAPFVPQEWPAPRYVASRAIEQAQNLAGLYVPLGKPFISQDWPAVPRRTSPLTEAAQNLLLTALAPTASAPFIPEDWTVPPRPIIRASEAVQNLLLTLLSTTQAAPFIPEDWTILPHIPLRQAETTQNIALTILPTTQAPFKPFDWEVQQLRVRKVWQEYTDFSLLTTVFPTIIYTFRTPITLPKPWTVPRPSSNEIPNNLLTLLPLTPPPFIATDWTIRQRPTGRTTEATFNLLFSTLNPNIIDEPFQPVEWTPPSRIVLRRHDYDVRLLEVVYVPFSPTDWTVVVRAKVAQSEATANPLLTLLSMTPAPFANYDWTPTPSQPHVSTATIDPNLSLSTLAPPGTFPAPFVSMDWTPIPHQPRLTLATADPNLLFTTLNPNPVATPFVSFDWTPTPTDRSLHLAMIEQNNLSMAGVEQPPIPPQPISDAWVGRRDHPKRKAWPLPPPAFPVEDTAPDILTFGTTPQTAYVPSWTPTHRSKPRGLYRGFVYRPPVVAPVPSPAVSAAQPAQALSEPSAYSFIAQTQARRTKERREEDVIITVLMQDDL